MAYWWVNHKQTFTQEIEGGYIWSPTTNANGARNQTYINLTLTNPGDTVFSYASGMIKAVGVAASPCREQAKPSEFGKAGDVWSATGWAVPIDWELLEKPLLPKAHINSILPLLPTKNSPLQTNGNGNQGCYLAAISNELGLLLLGLIESENVYAKLALTNDRHVVEDAEAETAIQNLEIDVTEKEQLIKARRGQGRFRQNVEAVESRCRVTGVNAKPLLIASHIKPWRECSNAERLDGHNGLLLAPHIDKLFDQGLISFSDAGDLLHFDHEIKNVLRAWGVTLPVNVGKFYPQQIHYLTHHRQSIYRQSSA